MNNAIIIPSLEPNKKILALVDDLFSIGFQYIVIVDDGSGIEYQQIFSELQFKGCIVYHHEKNMGKGKAIKTAISNLSKSYPEINGYITADSDGQHLPKDIKNVSEYLADNSSSLILGVRDFTSKNVPFKSRCGNMFSSIFFKLNTGVTCKDTQTGLRGFSSNLSNFALNVDGSHYEYEMNFLINACKSNIPLKMIPIKTIYEDNNKCSHFKPIADSFRIYKTPIKFAISSLICAVADLGIFTIITNVLNANVYALVSIATIIARVFSGVLNFTLNRKWSFFNNQSRNANWKVQTIRYFILFLTQMSISSLSVSVLSFMPISLTVIKIIVDSILFIFSYYIQRNWVFKNSKFAILNANKNIIKGK